jgi:hypothetical protein
MEHSTNVGGQSSGIRLPAERARVLLEINNAIVSRLDLTQVLQSISDCLRREINHDFAALALYDADRGELRLHALDFADNNGFLQKGQLIPLVGTPASLAFATRKPVLRHRPDFIEEKHEEGEPFEEAVIDAGIIRLRPVMITVGATVLALFPLALHGGPLWQPLCYTQIGGLAVATFITLLLVPVLYAIFVMDLKILKWETKEKQPPPGIAQVMDIAEHTAATA